MSVPTKNSIIGQFVNGRNSQDDFLQLATNNGGTVFAWIDYSGHFNGTFATTPAGSNTQIQFNNSGVFGASSQLTWADGVNALGVFQGLPTSGLSSNLAPVVSATIAESVVVNHTTGAASDNTGEAVYVQSDADTETFGMEVAVDATNLSASAFVGVEVDGYYNVPMSFTNNNVQTGFEAGLTAYGAGTSVGAASFFSGTINSGSGILQNAYGFYAPLNSNTGAGSITNSFGFHCDDLSNQATGINAAFHAAAQTIGSGNFAFYSVSANNYFGGVGTNITSLINPTVATSIANHNSPSLVLSGTAWNGAASVVDKWTIQNVVSAGTNPTSTLTFTPTGPGAPQISFLADFLVPVSKIQGVEIIGTSNAFFDFNTGASGTAVSGTSVGNAVGQLATYAATYVPSGFPVAGMYVTVTGFVTHAAQNNGHFLVSSASTSQVVVYNPNAIAETNPCTITTDLPYVNNSGGYNVGFGGAATTFAISGTSYTPEAIFELLPQGSGYSQPVAITAKGDNIDAAYLRIVNIASSGNHGLEIGSIIDGTGVAPVIFQLGNFNGIPSATLNKVFSSYNGVTLAGNGVPSEPFQIVSSGLTANYNSGSAKTVFTPTTGTVLRVTAMQAITTAATTGAATSTLPSLTLGWTDAGGIARTLVLLATSSTNTTAVYESGTTLIHTNSSTVVTVTSASYASDTAAQMAYDLVVTVEIL